jgi:hypothetical protein
MAITATQKSPLAVGNVATGRYLTDATAAAIVITLGFTPRYVRVVNVTSLDAEEWFEGMAAASAVKAVAAGTTTLITSNGITVSGNIFTIGLDTDVNVINEQISWLAIA